MHESSSPSHNFLTLADIVGVYGIKGWVRLRVRLDNPNLLLSLPDLTLIAAAESRQSARQSCLLYTSPSPRDATLSRMPSSA